MLSSYNCTVPDGKTGRQTERHIGKLTGHSSLPTPVGSVPEVIKSSFHTKEGTNKRGRRMGTGQSIIRQHRSLETSSVKKKGKKQEIKYIFIKKTGKRQTEHIKQCWVIVHSAVVHSLTAVSSSDWPELTVMMSALTERDYLYSFFQNKLLFSENKSEAALREISYMLSPLSPNSPFL